MVEALGGRAIEVAEHHRARYHAAAAVAANHLVALCGQVERLAAGADVPVSAYWELMADTLDNVRSRGAAASLTGPAARGDRATLVAHLEAIGADEGPLYLALADAAAAMADRPRPSTMLTGPPTDPGHGEPSPGPDDPGPGDPPTGRTRT